MPKARRINTLLALRAGLADALVEHEAHGLADAQDLRIRLAGCEREIRQEAPLVYNDQFPRWIETNAASIHTPDDHRENCSMCQALRLHPGPLTAAVA